MKLPFRFFLLALVLPLAILSLAGCGKGASEDAIAKGDAAFEAGNFSEAINQYKKVSWVGNYPARVAYRLAVSYDKTGATTKSAEQYFSLIEKYPLDAFSDQALADMNGWDNGKKSSVGRFNERLSSAYLRRGQELLKLGQTDQALAELNKAPVETSELSLAKGDCFVKKGEYSQAFTQFARSYELKAESTPLDRIESIAGHLNSSHLSTYYSSRMAYGTNRFQAGSYNEAINQFRKTRPTPTGMLNSEGLYKIGYCYEMLRDKPSALDSYKKAIIAEPASEWASKAQTAAWRVQEEIFKEQQGGGTPNTGSMPPRPTYSDYELQRLYDNYLRSYNNYQEAIRSYGPTSSYTTNAYDQLVRDRTAYYNYLNIYRQNNGLPSDPNDPFSSGTGTSTSSSDPNNPF